MKRTVFLTIVLVFFLPISTFPGVFGASNFWECILDEMPGVRNDITAIEVRRKCIKKFPNTTEVKKKSPIFGVKTASECVLKYGKDVSSPKGAKLVRAACYRLYQRNN